MQTTLTKVVQDYSYDLNSDPLSSDHSGEIYEGIICKTNQPVYIKKIPVAVIQKTPYLLQKCMDDLSSHLINTVRTTSNIYLIFERYHLTSEVLGRGPCGEVYKGLDLITRKYIAVKIIPTSQVFKNEKAYRFFQREIEMLYQLKCDSFVQLLDFKVDHHKLCLIFDYCDGGDLANIVQEQSVTESSACSILRQIALAFLQLYELNVCSNSSHPGVPTHRDLKPANILMHQGKVKIGDFGLAKIMDSEDHDDNTQDLRTPYYMAPEILKGENYGVKCDIWSAGVLFYELLFGRRPWGGCSKVEILKNIESKELVLLRKVSEEIEDLLRKMLKLKEEERISWKEVYDHPALKGID